MKRKMFEKNIAMCAAVLMMLAMGSTALAADAAAPTLDGNVL